MKFASFEIDNAASWGLVEGDSVVDLGSRYPDLKSAIAAGGHVMLQEVLCERVATLCLADPRVVAVTVQSAKPDIYPDARIGCEITRTRGVKEQ